MSQEGLRRCARLATKADFKSVFQQSTKSVDDVFKVFAGPNRRSFPRLGLAISRKSVKLAVERNRIKRVVRESFRHHQYLLGGYDFVVISQNNLARWENKALFESLQRHWARLVKRCPRQ